MLAINVTQAQDKDLPEWRKKGGYTFPVLLSEKGFAKATYGVNAAPTNYLLGAQHKAVFRHIGYGDGDEKRMEAEIRELLGLDPYEGTEATKPTASAPVK